MEKILIVDDSEKTRRMLRRHLVKGGYAVTEAENGEMALEEITRNLPDVVLLDVMMPDISGFDVCQRLRHTPQSDLVYIIMLTGVATDEQKVQGLDMGADDYVTKPFNVDELLARIRVGLRTVQKKRDAAIDPLTKLYNKGFFDLMLAQEVSKAQRYQKALTLIMADIDHFKQVNDTFGHFAGDQVLAAVGTIFRKHCRQSDLPVRWGGEELILLLPETDAPGGRLVAERVRRTIETHPFETVGRITASFGVASLQTGLQDLLVQVDAALYEAKQGGRNCVVVYGSHQS